mgnify:CR=1 FL=1
MTARTTMDDLIGKLRAAANAGTADYTLAGVDYWSDDQLQIELDQIREPVNYQEMDAIETYGVGGTVTYTEYRTYLQDWEKSPTIQDEGGTALGTAVVTFDANTGVATFASDTEGKTRRITGYTYNVNKAAANVWRKKAAHLSAAFDFSTDNHSIKKSQIYEHCMQMADMFDGFAGYDSGSAQLVRGDDVVR